MAQNQKPNTQSTEKSDIKGLAAQLADLKATGQIERVATNLPPVPTYQSTSPSPTSVSQQPDQQRQWKNPAQPQIRTIPLPPAQTQATGASSVSQTIKALPKALPKVVPAITSSAKSATLQIDMSKSSGGTNSPITNHTLTNIADGTVYIRGTQSTGAQNLAQNANFESNMTLPPAGWSATANSTLSYDRTSPQSGTQSLIVTATAQNSGATGNQLFSCQPGDSFIVSGYIMQSSVLNVGQIVLLFLDANKNILSVVSTGSSAGGSGSWTFAQATGVAPANTVFAQLKVQTGTASATVNNPVVVEFDNLKAVRQSTSLELTPISTSGTPTATTGLATQSGTSTTINIASSTWQFGSGQVNYNSGSVNPGSLGTWYIYSDDPGYAGGSVTYVVTATPSVCNAANGRIVFGKITTTGGGSAVSTGGGSGGGGPQGKIALA